MEKTPKNKCWIIGIDNDSFNYEPALELISEVKKHNKTAKHKHTMYRRKKTVQIICDKLNSM